MLLHGFTLALCAISITNAVKIGVQEYDPTVSTSSNATQVLEENIERLRGELSSIKNLIDVLVFPEYALTGITKDYKTFSIHIPKIEAEIQDYQNIVKRLSNIASEFGKYIIVHLFENGTDGNYYSTAVAFDNVGKIISKHRKNNLNQDEKSTLKSGNNSTDVWIGTKNEKYALMFGEDLFTTTPPNTTDSIIVLSSLVNRLPYEAVLSLYSGYALSNKKNVFVSGVSHPSTGRSGTASFKYNENNTLTMESYITGKQSSNTIVTDNTAQTIKIANGPRLRGLPGEDELKNLVYKLSGSLKTVDNLAVEKDKQLTNSAFTCSLSDIINDGDLKNFRLIQQTGEWIIGSQTKKVAFCGIAVQPNGTGSEFGSRFKTGVTMSLVRLNLNPKRNLTTVYPLSVNYDLKPISQLSYNNETNEILAKDATDVLLVGFLVVTGSNAFTFSASLLVVFVTLAVGRFL